MYRVSKKFPYIYIPHYVGLYVHALHRVQTGGDSFATHHLRVSQHITSHGMHTHIHETSRGTVTSGTFYTSHMLVYMLLISLLIHEQEVCRQPLHLSNSNNYVKHVWRKGSKHCRPWRVKSLWHDAVWAAPKVLKAANYRPTQWHIPEVLNPQQYSCENPKSRILELVTVTWQ